MSGIAKTDKNFCVKTNIKQEGLRFYDAQEFSIYGVKKIDGKYRRIPQNIAESVSEGVLFLHTNTAGGRVRFITDSPYIAISVKMDGLEKVPHMPYTGTIGFDLFADNQYIGTFVPPYDIVDGYESILNFSSVEERLYTINFPLYSNVSELFIGLKDGCIIKPAPEYSISKPIIYYGSSITQGGCASRPGNAYPSIIGRKLDCDYINLGFSGNALGEDAIAEYISKMQMSAFVFDYDHNAPSIEHLEATHKRMFQTIRTAQPKLPILILSRPKYYLSSDEEKRLEIIESTYQDALKDGDKNVYFIPGQFLIESVKENALVDNCHPNDSGFVNMAQVIGDKLEQILLT